MVSTPPDADWVAVTDGPLPLAEVFAWVVHPGCGAVVSFCGTVRDHSEGRPNVVSVEYEAYTEYVESRLADVAASARSLCCTGWGDSRSERCRWWWRCPRRTGPRRSKHPGSASTSSRSRCPSG